MAVEHVLQIPRTDSETDFVLVNVSSNGRSALDLKLLATEGENPYEATIKQSRISKLRDKKNQVSDGEWERILLSSLLHQKTKGVEVNLGEKLELFASKSGNSLAIHFRKNISGITQKLGEIILKLNTDQEIDTISWCGVAVQRAVMLETEVQDLKVQYEEQSRTIAKLNEQLEQLIVAKKTHEDSLLEKFRELLNSKKMHIRNQQRVLASAKPDSTLVTKISNAHAKASHVSKDFRVGKRKAKDVATSSASSEDESFERNVQTQKGRGEDSEAADTPDVSDQDATESGSGDDLDSAPRQNTLPDRGKSVGNGNVSDEDMQVDEPPPSRKLPFEAPDKASVKESANGEVTADASGLNKEAGNEDDETDDDEL